jgi:hypothetical protein
MFDSCYNGGAYTGADRERKRPLAFLGHGHEVLKLLELRDLSARTMPSHVQFVHNNVVHNYANLPDPSCGQPEQPIGDVQVPMAIALSWGGLVDASASCVKLR